MFVTVFDCAIIAAPQTSGWTT